MIVPVPDRRGKGGGSGRRSLKVRVKTARRRSASSTRWLERQLNDLRGKPIVGDTVITTLNLRAQRVALEQLGRTCGAVAALDPRTGKLLVMASSPSYDPNRIERNFGSIGSITANCRPAAPLVNRAHKKMIRRLAPAPVALTDAEIDESFAYFDTEDYRIGCDAFLKKKKPKFVGK